MQVEKNRSTAFSVSSKTHVALGVEVEGQAGDVPHPMPTPRAECSCRATMPRPPSFRASGNACDDLSVEMLLFPVASTINKR